MAIYAVHCPAGEAEPANALERARFLRLGYCRTATVFGPLWLAAHRLWRPLGLWLLGAAIVGAAVAFRLIGSEAALWLYVLSAFYLGLEARAFEGAALARGGDPLADVVCAADAATAERAFFARALAQPAPTRGPAPAPSAARPPQVLGLFPEAGG
jgi:hypothetical protein